MEKCKKTEQGPHLEVDECGKGPLRPDGEKERCGGEKSSAAEERALWKMTKVEMSTLQ